MPEVPDNVLAVKQQFEAQTAHDPRVLGIAVTWDGRDWKVVIVRKGLYDATNQPTEVDGVKVGTTVATQLPPIEG